MGGRAPQAISTHHSRPLRANEARFVCESADFHVANLKQLGATHW